MHFSSLRQPAPQAITAVTGMVRLWTTGPGLELWHRPEYWLRLLALQTSTHPRPAGEDSGQLRGTTLFT
jgi:hypothetical protein